MTGNTMPPAARSRLWQQVNEAAAKGLFRLQVCTRCDKVQYPPQEFCSRCLADELSWQTVSPMGKVLSWTRSRASTSEFFRDKFPLNIGLVKLDCGPVMVTYLAASCLQTGSRVQVTGKRDKSGQAVFFAAQPDKDPAADFNNIVMEEVKHERK